MDGDGQDIGTSVENILGAVSGVVVDVEQGYLAKLGKPMGGNGGVVDVAVSAAVGASGVMAGGAAQSKCRQRTKRRNGCANGLLKQING